MRSAPIAWQTYYAVAHGAGNFTVYRKLRYEDARVVPQLPTELATDFRESGPPIADSLSDGPSEKHLSG